MTFDLLSRNVYKDNTGKNHFSFLNKLPTALSNFENIFENNLRFACDVSVFLHYFLDAKGGTPILKYPPIILYNIHKLKGLNKTLRNYSTLIRLHFYLAKFPKIC